MILINAKNEDQGHPISVVSEIKLLVFCFTLLQIFDLHENHLQDFLQQVAITIQRKYNHTKIGLFDLVNDTTLKH